MDTISKFIKRYEEYELIRDNVAIGKPEGIPLTNILPHLSRFLPGVVKSKMYMVTAASGWSKTQFTKAIFVTGTIDWIDKHPNCDIDLKILYFALEESHDEFVDSLVIHYIQKEYGIYIPLRKLRGNSETPLSVQELDLVKHVRPHIIDKYISKITFIDHEYDPDGMYAIASDYLNDLAKVTYENVVCNYMDENLEEKVYNKKVIKDVKYHNPNTHVIVIADHLNLMEHSNGLKYAMERWSSHYCKSIITKQWNWTVINVVQQNMLSSEKAYDYKNQLNVDKTRPTTDGLGDSKIIGRDHHVIIGIYNPSHYATIGYYNDYNINYSKDGLYNYFRSATLLKNRLGDSGHEENLFFNGNACIFLPLPKDRDSKILMDLKNATVRYNDIQDEKYPYDPKFNNLNN